MDKEEIREKWSNRQNRSSDMQPLSEEMQPAGWGRSSCWSPSTAVATRKGQQRVLRVRMSWGWLVLEVAHTDASRNQAGDMSGYWGRLAIVASKQRSHYVTLSWVPWRDLGQLARPSHFQELLEIGIIM